MILLIKIIKKLFKKNTPLLIEESKNNNEKKGDKIEIVVNTVTIGIDLENHLGNGAYETVESDIAEKYGAMDIGPVETNEFVNQNGVIIRKGLDGKNLGVVGKKELAWNQKAFEELLATEKENANGNKSGEDKQNEIQKQVKYLQKKQLQEQIRVQKEDKNKYQTKEW